MTPEQEEAFRREAERLLDEQRTRTIDPGILGRHMREQSTRLAVTLTFLDQCVPPSQGEGQTS